MSIERTIAIAGLPVGAAVRVHVNEIPSVYAAGFANEDGYVAFDGITAYLGDSDVYVDAAGFQPYHEALTWHHLPQDADLPQPLNHQVIIGVDLPKLAPIVQPVPHLQISGIDFVDAAGARQVFNGCDQFCAFRQFLDGVDLTEQLRESRDLGFHLWRVFLMGSKAQNNVLELRPTDAGYWPALRLFAFFLNANGIVLLATVFVDAQDVMPKADDRRAHWGKVANELHGSTTLLSGGNEWSKNGFNPSELSSPSMYWSRGSDVGDVAPYRPYGSFAEFHPRRDLPASLMDTVASPVFIYGTNVLTGPLVIDEPPKMGTNGSSVEFTKPRTAYTFARNYATMCGAAVFHNWFGQRGLLMDGNTRECAKAWTRGMRL